MKARNLLLVLCLCAASTAVMAQDDGLGYHSWGVRLGFADSDGTNQVMGGVQFDLGEIARHLRLKPNAELGFGDEYKTVMANAPLHYMFRGPRMSPYAGGAATISYVDVDSSVPGSDDGGSLGFGVKAIGGLEWQLRKGNQFFTELNLGFGDVHDVQLMAGWVF